MRHLALPTGIIAVAYSLLVFTGPAGALTAETWVSRTGSDAGGCPITAPRRTFAFAHGQTSTNGTINILSSGNFGPVTITKSISIVADGADAVVNTVAGGAAIIVNGASIVVSLRGLTIDASSGHGVSFVNGAALHVRDCVIRRSNDGIRFAPSSKTSELFVADSIIADTLDSGVQVQPTGSAIARVVLDRMPWTMVSHSWAPQPSARSRRRCAIASRPAIPASVFWPLKPVAVRSTCWSIALRR
jgi:hypothetical protein